MSKLLCSSPRIILHPLAGERITKNGNYTVLGEHRVASRSLRRLYNFNKHDIYSYLPLVTADNIDQFYITDILTGENYPLFIQVRCGKCDCCKASKITSFVQRCEIETQLYDCYPMFVTLTYANEWLPKKGVNVRDVQLFFKRFRINLERAGYLHRIRYVLVGEYGSNFHRPHYHAIIWNLHQTDMLEFRAIRDILAKSWHMGFVQSRLVDPANNKTFYYTAKYLRKDGFVPDGCKKPFVCSSNRGGGLGSALLCAMSGHILRRLDTRPMFLNKFSGQSKELYLTPYVLDKIMPTVSCSIPSSLKNAMRTLNLCYAQMEIENDPNRFIFSKDYATFNSFFGRYLYAPQLSAEDLSRNASSLFRSSGALVRDTLEAVQTLSRWIKRGRDYFDGALRVADRRALYLSKLFEHVDEYTVEYIDLRSYNFRRSAAAACQREIL